MGSRGGGRSQPMGRIVPLNQIEARRRSTATGGIAPPSLAAISSATASAAAPIEAAARSETANTDGNAPEPLNDTAPRLAGSPPAAVQISRMNEVPVLVMAALLARRQAASSQCGLNP